MLFFCQMSKVKYIVQFYIQLYPDIGLELIRISKLGFYNAKVMIRYFLFHLLI